MAAPLSPLQALAWAPAASMDARRVRVRAGWNNPRGWARRVLDSGRLPPALRTECCLSTTGGPGRFPFRQAPGFVHLGYIGAWGHPRSPCAPSTRAVRRFELFAGWQRWVVQGHVCPRSTCAGGGTAAGTGGSPHCSRRPPAVSVRPNRAVGTRRGAAALPGPLEFALQPPSLFLRLAPGGWAAPSVRTGGTLGALSARSCPSHSVLTAGGRWV